MCCNSAVHVSLYSPNKKGAIKNHNENIARFTESRRTLFVAIYQRTWPCFFLGCGEYIWAKGVNGHKKPDFVRDIVFCQQHWKDFHRGMISPTNRFYIENCACTLPIMYLMQPLLSSLFNLIIVTTNLSYHRKDNYSKAIIMCTLPPHSLVLNVKNNVYRHSGNY